MLNTHVPSFHTHQKQQQATTEAITEATSRAPTRTKHLKESSELSLPQTLTSPAIQPKQSTKMAFSSMIVYLMATLATTAFSAPVTLEARADPLAKCLTNSDGSVYIPPNSVCMGGYSADGYQYGAQKVPFGLSYVSRLSSPGLSRESHFQQPFSIRPLFG
jgi:hypothetical protein